MRHLFKNPKEYEARRCHTIKENGDRCKSVHPNGHYLFCKHHMNDIDKERFLKEEKEAKEKQEEEKQDKIKKAEEDKKEEKQEVRCRKKIKNNKPCTVPPMHGFDVCWQHATKKELKRYKHLRRKAIKKNQNHDYMKDYREPIKKGTKIIKKGTSGGKTFPKKRKKYNGYIACPDNERIKIDDGNVYGFYAGAFLNRHQRKLFESAPIGDIDDDIKVVRYLIRDALENQLLYIKARAKGNVQKGFVLFSKEVSVTEDGDGNSISKAIRTIKRKNDYLKEIQELEKLLVRMEEARIELKKAGQEYDESIVPFNFNIMPPSEDIVTEEIEDQEVDI